METRSWSRRETLQAAVLLGILPHTALTSDAKMLTRPVPAGNEELPVIGLGTWQVFDIDGNGREMETRRAIVRLLVENGGSLIDSSPMYGRAEKVVGDVVRAEGNRDSLFLASKVWTDGKAAGESQIRRSIDLMAAQTLDLMQVHNLRDLDVHMHTIRDLQQDGQIRYSGITDYRASALDVVAQAMREYRPDFVQINYSLAEREAAEKVLPLAADMGIAVLVNRPFVSGRLFRAVGDRDLPPWASDFAATWGQFFLKFVVSHPAVTCAIPATSKLHHMTDNLAAGVGALPDDAMRQRMVGFLETL